VPVSPMAVDGSAKVPAEWVAPASSRGLPHPARNSSRPYRRQRVLKGARFVAVESTTPDGFDHHRDTDGRVTSTLPFIVQEVSNGSERG
jgi:hypothetical protein